MVAHLGRGRRGEIILIEDELLLMCVIKTGRGRMFISLDVESLQSVRVELEGRGVAVENGRWGYPLMVVHDPDGNELYFPYPADGGDR
jgi:hypothetical protein